jgi:hypothetical protein
MELDVKSAEFTELLTYSYNDILTPIYWREFVIFSSSYSGVDNLYALNTLTKDQFRITVSSFGCKYPSIYNNTLLFSDYSANGYMIGELPIDPRSWHTIDVVKKEPYELAQSMTRQEDGVVDFSKMKDTTFSSKPYSKILHMINIHSWMPFYMEYNGSQISENGLGFQIQSQDKLGTTITSAGYKQNYGKTKKSAFAKITYTGLFPVFDIEISHGPQSFTDLLSTGDTATILYKASEVIGSVTVPLNFSSCSYYRYLNIGAQTQLGSYNKISVTPTYANNTYNDFINSGILVYTMSFMNILQTSKRDILPKWGQLINVGYGQSPFNTTSIYNDMAFGEMQLYVPGFMKNHSIKLYGGFQWNSDTTFSNFNSQITLPRGYTEQTFAKKEMFSLSANYTLPLLYPDLELGSFMYINRLRGTGFVDYAEMLIAPKSQKLVSYGVELMADFHIIQIVAPINFGARASFTPSNGNIFFETLFSINFNQI